MISDEAPAPKPRILAVLPDVPWPLNSGKRIREWAVVSALSEVGDLDAITVGLDVDQFSTPPGVGLRSGASVVLHYRGKLGAGLRLAAGRPWRIAVADWHAARDAIEDLNDGTYDLVWFGSLDSWVELRHSTRAHKIIIDIDDIETEKTKSFLATPPDAGLGGRFDRLQGRIEKVMWSRIQKASVKRADVVSVCSATDVQVLGAIRGAVIPNCYPEPQGALRLAVEPNTLLMVGNYSYEPNLEGAKFMAQEVMPKVLKRCPSARLLLVGRGSQAEIKELGNLPGVEAVGAVDSTAEYLQMSTIAVAPVRFGGGTRVKLIEAFAYSLPSVSTTIGCNGLAVTNGQQLLIEDDASGFASACCELLADEALAERLGKAGYQLYQEQYRPSVVRDHIRELASDLMSANSPKSA